MTATLFAPNFISWRLVLYLKFVLSDSCLFIVSASDGSGTGGPGAVPGVILGTAFSYTRRDETGELLTVI